MTQSTTHTTSITTRWIFHFKPFRHYRNVLSHSGKYEEIAEDAEARSAGLGYWTQNMKENLGRNLMENTLFWEDSYLWFVREGVPKSPIPESDEISRSRAFNLSSNQILELHTHSSSRYSSRQTRKKKKKAHTASKQLVLWERDKRQEERKERASAARVLKMNREKRAHQRASGPSLLLPVLSADSVRLHISRRLTAPTTRDMQIEAGVEVQETKSSGHQEQSNITTRRLAIAYQFMSLGILFGVWAAVVPVVQDMNGLDHQQLGSVLALTCTGCLVALPLSSRFCKSNGSARGIAAGTVCTPIAIAGTFPCSLCQYAVARSRQGAHEYINTTVVRMHKTWLLHTYPQIHTPHRDVHTSA